MVFSAALSDEGTSVLMQANKQLQKQFVTSPTQAAGCFVCLPLWIFFFLKGLVLFLNLSGEGGQALSPHCQQQPGAALTGRSGVEVGLDQRGGLGNLPQNQRDIFVIPPKLFHKY